MENFLLHAEHIRKWYGEDKEKKIILDNLNLSVKEGDFVGILGPSGSGKSTFLRILAGLIPPSMGRIIVKGVQLKQPNPNVAIVFQNFALYPWLTVEQNVALGLIARNITNQEKEKRVKEAIHLIGLHGFESAYPKEISGGMKQRVGFARALVVQPEILMMDEPFSALDVLTAENLRHELLSLWLDKKIPTKAILMVTHNIDEAVSMVDRMFVLSSDPGRIRVEIPGLPIEQRAIKTPEHLELVDNIYQIMTNPHENPAKLISGAKQLFELEESEYQILPQISMNTLKAFLKRIEISGGKENLSTLQKNIALGEMLGLTELVALFGFAGIEEHNMVLTKEGKIFISSDIEKAKEILRRQLVNYISLIQFMLNSLKSNIKHEIYKKDILKHLGKYFNTKDAELQFKIALGMGIYSDLFIYNRTRGSITATKYIT